MPGTIDSALAPPKPRRLKRFPRAGFSGPVSAFPFNLPEEALPFLTTSEALRPGNTPRSLPQSTHPLFLEALRFEKNSWRGEALPAATDKALQHFAPLAVKRFGLGKSFGWQRSLIQLKHFGLAPVGSALLGSGPRLFPAKALPLAEALRWEGLAGPGLRCWAQALRSNCPARSASFFRQKKSSQPVAGRLAGSASPLQLSTKRLELSAWPFELNLKEERFARPESHPGEALRWERLASRPPGKLGPEHRTPAPSPISPPFLLEALPPFEALRVEKEQSSKKGGALRSSRPTGSAPLFYVCQGQAPRRLLAKRFGLE